MSGRQATHSICFFCWDALTTARGQVGRIPHRVLNTPTEPCCFCGQPTGAGIYVRARNDSLRCRGDCQKERDPN